MILTKPASRGAFLAAKLTAISLNLAVAVTLGSGLGYIYTALLYPVAFPLGGYIAMAAILWWTLVVFVAITLLAGLQTISPSYYEAASLDGASDWQQFRYVTLPLLTPIIAVVMTFSVLFTFTDFQLIYVITRGGPLNATHLMATLSFQRAISGGALGEGAAISIAMVPFLLGAILISFFGLQRRAWQQGGADK